MRDLKNVIFFDDLLQESYNALVRQAKEEGKYALGYTCYFMPEVLLDLPGCFSVRLRAPRCTSPDMATYYMSSRVCHYARSLLERPLEGGYNFIDAQLGTETCAGTCRFQEHLAELPDLIQNEKFFVTFTDVPFKKNENSIEHFAATLQKHVLDELHEHFGIDTSDEALRATIEAHNEICDIITQIGEFRKLDKPTITGTEFHIINLVSMVCPKYLILPYLRETLEDLKTREADAKPNYRVKVVLAGSENDDPDFTKLIESCGALVVADRYCYGSLPGREKIEIRKGETALRAVARHYLETSVCPRSMEQSAMRQRKVHRRCRQRIQGGRRDRRIQQVLRVLELRACGGYDHPAARLRSARVLDRERVHQLRLRPAPHALPGVCGKSGDQEDPGEGGREEWIRRK